MRKSTTLLSALAIAGLGLAGGSAFTGSGLTNNAGATQFVGGTVSQTFTGATLSTVAYTYSDASNTAIHSALLTFAADADGKLVAIAFTGSASGTFVCTAVEATGHTSTCTASVNAADVTAVDITVS